MFFSKKKPELPKVLTEYKMRSERQTGFPLRQLCVDGAAGNLSGEFQTFCGENGIELKPSPPHAHQSNGTAERLIQEFWQRTRVLLFASKLPHSIWAEAMHHANWLRNRLLSTLIQGDIPILLWQPRTRMHFNKVPVNGQPRFAFRYRSESVRNKRFLVRSVHGNFVGMESDETLFRIYVPETNSITLTRVQDFRLYRHEKLAGVAFLLDGLARQSAIESLDNSDRQAEDVLMRAFHAYAYTNLAERSLNR